MNIWRNEAKVQIEQMIMMTMMLRSGCTNCNTATQKDWQ